ncbi:MAG: cytochrome b/b6 domain-containing protein [Eubacteriales bacterium]
MINIRKLISLLQWKKPRHTWPARLLHWIYAPAFLACSLSGSYITRPSHTYGYKDTDSARKTHFIFQYVLIFSYIARVYYGYAAKNLGELVPGRKDLKDLPKFLKYEFFLTKKKPMFPKYNPGQKLIFTAFGLIIPVQAITGLALYAPGAWQKSAALAGGLNPLRKLHYLAAVVINALLAGHIYFIITDSLKKLKSIFTGYK